MAGIQLSGLASGFDWKSTVTQLMAIERVPQDNLRKQQAAAEKLQAAFDTLKTNLTALKTAASALSTSFTGSPRTVSVASGDGKGTASTSSGAVLGTYSINVLSLPKASTALGSANLFPSLVKAQNLTLRDYKVTEGTVTINGNQYTLADSDLDMKIVDVFLAGGGVNLGSAGMVANVAGSLDGKNALVLEGINGASIAMGGPGDSSSFMSALGIREGSSKYTQTVPLDVLSKISLGDLNGGSFAEDNLRINGVDLGLIGPTVDLGSVVSKINSASATGVTATIDPSSGALRLTANANGAYAISVEDGAAARALGLAPTFASFKPGAGTKFELSVNGEAASGPETSTTGDIDLSQYGYGATKITPSATGVFSVRVTANASDNRAKINSLISAYNTLKQMVDESTKVTTGTGGKVSASVFSNRSDVNSLLSNIRSRVYSEVKATGVSTQYNTMGKIGIGFDRNGTMSVVDSAKLDAALTNNPSAIDTLLNAGSTGTSVPVAEQGVVTRLVNLMTSLTGTGGLVASATTAITSQTKRLQTQISAMDRSLEQQRASLEASFIAMERAQSRYNSMSAQITSAFNSNK
jgi:flagellar hook-associated protein 2